MMKQEEAARFISGSPGAGPIVILYHGDADGVAGAVIAYKCLAALGSGNVTALPLGRGLNPHSPETRARLEALHPRRLIIVDSGSRAGEVLPGVLTLIVDHHTPLGEPPVEVFYNTYTEDPPRPASLAMYDVCNSAAAKNANTKDAVKALDWVATIGTVGDLGPRAPFLIVEASFKRYGRKNIADSTVLVNAGQRHRDYRVELAFNVLFAAAEPSDIAKHRVQGSEELERLRKEVQDEL